jgi:protein-S-isoprenylcysteine O-methyltransferase Ste14
MHARYALLRHLLVIVALPVIVAVCVPLWLARQFDVGYAPPAHVAGAMLQAVGALMLLLGVALFVSSLYQIAKRGWGSVAPWDPPRRLVVRGPYRRVRNPMISGVLFTLFGEALLLQSLPLAGWALAFFLLSTTYVPVLEEPQLEARFGEEYRRYRRHVSRFLPRLRAWNPDAE